MSLKLRHPIESGSIERAKFNYSTYFSALGAVLPDPQQIVETSLLERNGTTEVVMSRFNALPVSHTNL